MHPHHVCTLLSTLPNPPWTEPLNWDLHFETGEPRVPFHLYIGKPASTYRVSLFPQFRELPAELQLRILSSCSARTLFTVMQVSKTLRIEASKLFWGSADVYYLVKGSWLVDGGYPGDTYFDLGFLKHVQNIEVHLPGVALLDYFSVPGQRAISVIPQEKVKTFWASLKTRCPKAKNVVFNYVFPSGEATVISKSLQALVNACPSHIAVSAFVLEQKSSPDSKNGGTGWYSLAARWQKSLYRPSAVDDGTWKKVATGWDRTTVLMPTKWFRGPVGEYQRQRFKAARITLQESAFTPLMIDAVERYYFDREVVEPFECLEDGCEAYFERPGQWTLHAAQIHYLKWDRKWSMDNALDFLPEELKRAFEKRREKLNRQKEGISKELKRLYNDWNDGKGRKRIQMEREWLEQLEHDEAWRTGGTARESKVWKIFAKAMKSHVFAVEEIC